MRSRAQTVDNLNASYQAIENLMGSLSDDDWSTQSLCPDWDTRGVILHLAGVEHALSGWKPASADEFPPFNLVESFVADAAPWSNGELAERVAAVFAARRNDLDTYSDDDFALQQKSPVGPASYHRFMDVRVFDFWVHERDITTPLGRPTDDGGPTAECAVDEVDMSIGYIVGKKIGLPDGMGIAFHLTGPVERDVLAKVDGRAARVDQLDDPSVEVSVDSTTFVQLACGRLDPQGPIDDGRITWTGDAEWGEKAARNLAFTM